MGLLKQKRDLFLVYFAPTNKTISLMIVKNLLIRANYRKVVKNRLKLKGFHFKDSRRVHLKTLAQKNVRTLSFLDDFFSKFGHVTEFFDVPDFFDSFLSNQGRNKRVPTFFYVKGFRWTGLPSIVTNLTTLSLYNVVQK